MRQTGRKPGQEGGQDLKLKEIRKARGLKQGDIAKALGVTQATVSFYEQGKREPDLKTLRKLATALNVTIDELVK